jgi:hypothetical protein
MANQDFRYPLIAKQLSALLLIGNGPVVSWSGGKCPFSDMIIAVPSLTPQTAST